MRTASVSKLKASLSSYLRHVKRGDEVMITDRGRPVARLSPVHSNPSDPEHLKELERQGKIRSGTGKLPADFWDTPFVADPDGAILKALLEEREENR